MANTRLLGFRGVLKNPQELPCLRAWRYERVSVQSWRFRSNGTSWPKISGRRGRTHQPFFFSGN